MAVLTIDWNNFRKPNSKISHAIRSQFQHTAVQHPPYHRKAKLEEPYQRLVQFMLLKDGETAASGCLRMRGSLVFWAAP